MPILIAEATDEAVRHALLLSWCHQLTEGRPPHEGAPAEARAAAGELARALQVLDLLRGTRRDVRGLRRKAQALAGQLVLLGLPPPP
ncbi:MAG TPA: hypothetical protein VKA46_29650 [Gemmataceae bacterium]|nr:hypothetical protein [Gemmataceae bacterium]